MINKEGWEIKRFDEVFNLQMGKTPNRNNLAYWENGAHNWVSIADIKGEKYISKTKEQISELAIMESGIKPIPANTVIMSFKLSIGKTAITTNQIYSNEAIMSFNIKHGHDIIPDFLYFYLSNYKWGNNNRAVMGETLNKATISAKRISIPPLPIQQQIVSELDTLNEIITKKKQQLAELDNLAQATFYDMFGDPVRNEKSYPIKSLGDLCEITSSKRIYAEEYQQEGVPFYRSKEIVEKGKKDNISLELFISNERYNEIKNKFGIPQIGDILMTAVGTIGEIWVVDSDAPFYFKDGNIVWLKMNKQNNSTFFLFALGLLVKEYKTKLSVGSAYSALTIVNLKNMKVVFPALELQTQFADKINAIEKQKELIKKSINDTQLLFDYTMDKYFN
jgi:type I restriction enzyme S subunit